MKINILAILMIMAFLGAYGQRYEPVNKDA
jgi:hypothetical protein